MKKVFVFCIGGTGERVMKSITMLMAAGMSTHGLQWFPGIINNNAFAALSKDWDANVIRFAMYVTEGGYDSNPSIKQTAHKNSS